MTLRTKLEESIHAKIVETGRECTLIVMHPKTWENLFEEFFNYGEIPPYNPDPFLILRYRGIRVFRSLDITEKTFEIR